MSTRTTTATSTSGLRLGFVWIPLLLSVALLWSYWPTIAALLEFWQVNDDYSVGALVPVVALYLLWKERAHLAWTKLEPSWSGLLLLAFSQLVRFIGLYYAYASLERYSLVLCVSGIIASVGGWRIFRRLIWIQAFLLLMAPLPNRVHIALVVGGPLQGWATGMAAFGLELLGYYVTRDGNVLTLNDTTSVMVAEACSGLRMLTAFVFTAAVLNFMIDRPMWQKVTALVSSIPIAVVSNGLRVLLTAIAIHVLTDPTVESSVHDIAGLLMMPLAILFLLALFNFLARLAGSKDANTRKATGGGRGRGKTVQYSADSMIAGTKRYWALAAVMAVMLAAGWGHRDLQSRIERALKRYVAPVQELDSLPLELGRWKGEDVVIEERVLQASNFDDKYVNRVYYNSGVADWAGVFIGYVGRPRAHFGHRPDVCYAANGWDQESQENVTVRASDGTAVPSILYEFRKPNSQRMLVLATYIINGKYRQEAGALVGFNARNVSLFGERPAYLTRIQVSLGFSDDNDRATRLSALRELVGLVAERTTKMMPFWEE